ncbi:MAG: hypothetical protein OXG68_11535 [Chloroflexi bacterium]|nr:hypothetical protein [Chloroflexota bacterium]
MNSIPIEIVMYVTGLSEAQLPPLHEADTDTIRSLVENPQAEQIYQIDRRSGMHIFRFAPITDPRLIAWIIGLVQGMGGGILNIRREVLEGAIT